MNFLETDFKRRRIPKRSQALKDRAGNLIGVPIKKYSSFKRSLIKIISKPKNDFSINISRGKHTTQAPANLTDVVLGQALKKLENPKNSLSEVLETKIMELFVKYESDHEIFTQEAIALYAEILNKSFISSSVRFLEGTLQRDRDNEDEDSEEISESLSRYFLEDLESEISEALGVFIVDQSTEKLTSILEDLISQKNVRKVYSNFFESLSIADLHTEIAELFRNKKLKEELELYLYFGELKHQKRTYPLFFIPLSVEENLDTQSISYKLSFEKRFYINKKAIEYVYQELAQSNTAAQISNIIGDRIQYVDEGSDLVGALNSKISNILSHFKLNGEVDFSKDNLTTSKNQQASINNNFSIALFDKADESSINDYEELIQLFDSEDLLGNMFSKLISNFIEKEPQSISNEVLDQWDDTSTSDRLVFSSPIPLNEEQRKILSAIDNKKAKFITVQGPPGTGKSHTITAILFEAILKNKSVLMLSDKKEALDVVEDKLTETLNNSRMGENFQNPILRLGREGNTYSKILQTSNVENIRSHYRASQDSLKQSKPKKVEDDLKGRVKEYVDSYSKIKPKELKEYLDFKSKLEIDEANEELLINNCSSIKDLCNGTKNLSTIKENSKLKEIATSYNLKTVHDVGNLMLALQIALEFKENYPFIKKLNSVSKDKKDLLKNSLVEYVEVKGRFFSFLLADFQLQKWNQRLNKELDFLEMIDFKLDENFKILTDYQALLNDLEKKVQKLPHSKKEIDQLVVSLITDSDENYEYPEIKKYAKNIVKYKDIIRNDQFSDSPHFTKIPTHQNIFEHNFVATLSILEPLERYASLAKKINEDFSNVSEIDLANEIRTVQSNATVKMANIFDKRFVDFVDNSKSTALTLKKMISKKQKFPRESIEQLRSAFPCIIAGIRDYADYVPLAPELFDLIVIDEASQVSIAQAFPAILRAKKIIVLGDKKQFSNVKSSNASKLINSNYQDSIRDSFLETYGSDPQKMERSKVFDIRISILEFFENITNYDCLLKKHFRGYPEIISFSSKNFYNNELQTIKIRAKPIEEVITFRELPHDEKNEIRGNINTIECNFIIQEIEKLCDQEDPPSVGVITPMRDQQKFILSEIEKSPRYPEMKKLKVKVMTFDSCQGEERDIIFYSFVDSPKKDISFRVLGSKLDLNNMDPEENLRLQRLNVGMSRAKEQIYLVTSKPVSEFKGNAFRILSHYQQEIEAANKLPDKEELESPMEEKLLDWITQTAFFNNNKENLEIQAQFEVGKYLKALDPLYRHPNYRSDFLMTYKVNGKAKKLIIEYDGFIEHFVERENVNEFNYDHYYNEEDIEREKVLEGYGFPFLRLNKFNLGKDPISELSNKLEGFFLRKNSQLPRMS